MSWVCEGTQRKVIACPGGKVRQKLSLCFCASNALEDWEEVSDPQWAPTPAESRGWTRSLPVFKACGGWMRDNLRFTGKWAQWRLWPSQVSWVLCSENWKKPSPPGWPALWEWGSQRQPVETLTQRVRWTGGIPPSQPACSPPRSSCPVLLSTALSQDKTIWQKLSHKWLGWNSLLGWQLIYSWNL